jgi:ABC-type microcin C transport system permease subunit YejB
MQDLIWKFILRIIVFNAGSVFDLFFLNGKKWDKINILLKNLKIIKFLCQYLFFILNF